MPFWKQSDDPWDRRPDARPTEPTGPKEDPIDSLKAWNGRRKAAAREKAEAKRLPPEKCPWCGKDMEQGFLTGGRDGTHWYPGVYKFDPFRGLSGDIIDILDDGAGLAAFKIAWLCRDCKKMAFNAPVPEDGDGSARGAFTASGQVDETKEEEESGG